MQRNIIFTDRAWAHFFTSLKQRRKYFRNVSDNGLEIPMPPLVYAAMGKNSKSKKRKITDIDVFIEQDSFLCTQRFLDFLSDFKVNLQIAKARVRNLAYHCRAINDVYFYCRVLGRYSILDYEMSRKVNFTENFGSGVGDMIVDISKYEAVCEKSDLFVVDETPLATMVSERLHKALLKKKFFNLYFNERYDLGEYIQRFGDDYFK